MKEKILLVEDNKIQKLANERILHKAGYTVFTAMDGEDAIRVAWEKAPDLILLDMLLPKMGGIEVLHALKSGSATANIPVIAFSGLPQTNSAKLQNEGASDYFEKSRLLADPNGEEEFLNMIEKTLQQAKNTNEAAMSASASGSGN